MKLYGFHLTTIDDDEITFISENKNARDKFAEFIKIHYKGKNSNREYDCFESDT